MGLFQKKPDVSSSLPLYRMLDNTSSLVIGLGNPGKEYDMTRHNIGFVVLEKFAHLNNFSGWQTQKRLQSKISLGRIGGNMVILAQPLTFMNDSGASAHALQNYYKITNSQTLVVYDELALPLGQLRARQSGSDAGHNGIKSLIDHIGKDFGRLRIGIAGDRAITDSSKYVLANFSKKEQVRLIDVTQEACAMISEFIHSSELPHDTRTVL